MAAGQSPLISADDLDGLLGERSVKLFDVRGTWRGTARALPEDYEAGHIPGARFLDWTKHLIEQDVPLGLASVADKAGAERSFAALGIDDGDLVVLYDDYHHMFAGRLWWAMRVWGFANVLVLNGGWGHWVAQGKPVSTASPETAPGTFRPKWQDGLRVSLDEFLKTKDRSCVVDARGSTNYAGKPDDPRTGHIPDVINVPYSAILDPDTGLFLAPETLSRVFDKTTLRWREKPITASCGSGYAATVILLALAALDQPARLFDGSFALWKQDPNRPIEQSPSA